MAVHVLIVDTSEQRTRTMRELLERGFPGISVSHHRPGGRSGLAGAFDWSRYDLVLIGGQFHSSGKGTDWLRDFSGLPEFPPAVLMLDEPDLSLAARAVRAGAYSAINTRELSLEELRYLVDEAVNSRGSSGRADAGARESGPAAGADEDLQAQAQEMHGYRFRRLIARGATSRVYLAERTSDGRTIVLKLLDVSLAKNERTIKRFTQEAAIASGLQSDHVVQIYDHGVTNRYAFIAMEFFPRGDLRQRLKRRISRDGAVRYMLDIARGLQIIHAAGIVHRDLKPGNVMFRADDSLALADFGISKELNNPMDLTRVGGIMGTPYYMSPEQARGKPVDHRTDFYSAGVMLFQMLTGKRPYRGNSFGTIIEQHVHAEIPRLPQAFEEFQPLIDQLLAKRPEERCQDAEDIIEALRRVR